MISYYRSFLSVILVLLLCGCGTTVECIDPDDWGGDLKISVNSSPSNPQPVDKAKPYGDQYISWTQGFQLTGKPVVMIVDNAVNQAYDGQTPCHDASRYTSATDSWRFILANNFSKSPYKCDPTKLSCPSLSLCQFSASSKPYGWCPTIAGLPCDLNMASGILPNESTPCVLYQGLGLYSQITKNPVGQSADPPLPKELKCKSNMTDSTNCVLHIGNNACLLDASNASFSSCKTPFYSQGCPAGGASFVPPSDCKDTTTESCFIYFKILDRYYSDNYGQYNVRFKQGVMKQGSPGIITTFVGMVQSILCDDSESEFKNLVREGNYLTYIRIVLTLYIIFIGIGYLTGFVDLSAQELIIRVFKMALVIQLITTESSWSFFYNYFFKFFQQGIGEITGIIFGDAVVSTKITIPGIPATSSCHFQNLSGFASFDKVLKELLSYETSRKILSLIIWEKGGYVGGAILVVIIYALIAVVLFILLKSIMIYLMCYLTISLLIILAPLFIPFILFNLTRHWFDGWLKNLVSYFIQPIIILTFAFFMIQIFMYQMHYLFGYRVCFKEWFQFVSGTPLDIKVFAWQYDFQSSPEKKCILTPNSLLAPNQSGQAQIGDSSNTSSNNNCTAEQSKAGKCINQNSDNNNPNLQGKFQLVTWGDNPYHCSLNNNYYTPTAHGEYCTPYTCTQKRYVDYPYLNPEISSDQARITELQKSDPELISLKDIGILVLVVWFMMQFNNVVPSIARKISGNPQSMANMAGAGAALGGTLARLGGKAAGQAINHGLYKPLVGRRRDLFKDMKIAKQYMDSKRDNNVRRAAKMGEYVGDKLSKAPLPLKLMGYALRPDKALSKGINKISTGVQNAPGIRHGIAGKDYLKGKATYLVKDRLPEKATDAYKAAKGKATAIKDKAKDKIHEKTAPVRAEYKKAKASIAKDLKAAPGIRHGIAAKKWSGDKVDRAGKALDRVVDKVANAPVIKPAVKAAKITGKAAVAVKRFWLGGGPEKPTSGSTSTAPATLAAKPATPGTTPPKPDTPTGGTPGTGSNPGTQAQQPAVRQPGALQPKPGAPTPGGTPATKPATPASPAPKPGTPSSSLGTGSTPGTQAPQQPTSAPATQQQGPGSTSTTAGTPGTPTQKKGVLSRKRTKLGMKKAAPKKPSVAKAKPSSTSGNDDGWEDID